jgi:hypothetical protein
MNISVSSLVRRLEKELEAEKLKSAKLEIEVTQLKERLRQLDVKHHEDVSKIMKPNILSNPYSPYASAIPSPFQPPTV